MTFSEYEHRKHRFQQYVFCGMSIDNGSRWCRKHCLTRVDLIGYSEKVVTAVFTVGTRFEQR